MISELLFVTLLSFNSCPPSVHIGEEINENVLIESNDSCSTFLTPNGTYLKIFKVSNNPTRTSTTDFFNDDCIQNKYYIDGYATTFNTNPLMVGKSSILDPFGNNANYKTVFGLNLSDFPRASAVINAGLIVDKASGNLNSVYTYKVANTINYSQINGSSTFSTSFVSLTTISSGSFNLDLTDTVVDYLEEGYTDLNIILEGHENNKTCNLYSTSNSSHCPRLYVEFTYFGNAPSFSSLTNLSSANCLGFVRKLNQDLSILSQLQNALPNISVNQSVMQTTVFDVVKNHFGVNLTRLLSSYDSHISSTERRIVLRLRIYSNNHHFADDYHFACQCSDGSWADKKGVNGTITNYSGESSPETTSNMWYPDVNNVTSSERLYFAYSIY